MHLTEHEQKIIALLATHTNRQIAATLQISTTTVIDDLARLYRKLGVLDRAGVIAKAGAR